MSNCIWLSSRLILNDDEEDDEKKGNDDFFLLNSLIQRSFPFTLPISLSHTHSLFIYLWSSPPFSLQLSVYRNVFFSLSVCTPISLFLSPSLSISVCTSISFFSFPLSNTLYLWISLSPSLPLPFNLYLTHIYLPFLSPFDKYHVCHKKTFRLFMGTKHAPQQQSCISWDFQLNLATLRPKRVFFF